MFYFSSYSRWSAYDRTFFFSLHSLHLFIVLSLVLSPSTLSISLNHCYVTTLRHCIQFIRTVLRTNSHTHTTKLFVAVVVVELTINLNMLDWIFPSHVEGCTILFFSAKLTIQNHISLASPDFLWLLLSQDFFTSSYNRIDFHDKYTTLINTRILYERKDWLNISEEFV